MVLCCLYGAYSHYRKFKLSLNRMEQNMVQLCLWYKFFKLFNIRAITIIQCICEIIDVKKLFNANVSKYSCVRRTLVYDNFYYLYNEWYQMGFVQVIKVNYNNLHIHQIEDTKEYDYIIHSKKFKSYSFFKI